MCVVGEVSCCLFFGKILFIFRFMCVCLNAYVYVVPAEARRLALDPLGLELQTAVSYSGGAGH